MLQSVPAIGNKSTTADSLVRGLSAERFAVRWAASGDDALASLHAQPQREIILNWMLPGTRGADVLRAARTQGQRVPFCCIRRAPP